MSRYVKRDGLWVLRDPSPQTPSSTSSGQDSASAETATAKPAGSDLKTGATARPVVGILKRNGQQGARAAVGTKSVLFAGAADEATDMETGETLDRLWRFDGLEIGDDDDADAGNDGDEGDADEDEDDDEDDDRALWWDQADLAEATRAAACDLELEVEKLKADGYNERQMRDILIGEGLMRRSNGVVRLMHRGVLAVEGLKRLAAMAAEREAAAKGRASE